MSFQLELYIEFCGRRICEELLSEESRKWDQSRKYLAKFLQCNYIQYIFDKDVLIILAVNYVLNSKEYSKLYPELAADFIRRMNMELPIDFAEKWNLTMPKYSHEVFCV